MAKKETMAKNGLAVSAASRFVALRGGMNAVRANLDATGESLSASDLIRVPTPTAGGTTWCIPGPAGDESAKSIAGVLCFYQKCGVLWPSLDTQPGAMPVLRTWDLEIAEQIGPIPADMLDVLEPCRIDERHFDWAKCGYNQWGSGKNGFGKRCKEQRLLFVLRENALLPLLITVQPGSLKSVVKFVKSLGLQSQIPYYCCAIIDLSLEKVVNRGGQPYSQIVPKLVGTLSEADGEMVKKQWTDPLAEIVRNVALDRVDAAEEDG